MLPQVLAADQEEKERKAAQRAADLTEFKTWFKMVGGKSPNLQVIDTGSRGLGIEALSDFDEGDDMISVPMETVICRKTMLDRKTSEIRGISPQARSSLSRINDDHDLLVLLLIRERALGDSSYYAPYIKLLPKRALPLVSSMPDARQKQWMDETTYHRAKAEASKRKNRYRRLRDPLKDLLQGIDEAIVQEMLTPEGFAWADSLIGSRALTMGREGKFLVPLADMINYAPHPQARTRNYGKNFKKYHRILGGNFLIKADRHTALGAEVLEDYGDNDSELYFHTLGFVPKENPFDCVTVRLPAPKTLSKQRTLASKLRVPLNPEGCVRPDKPLPDSLLYHIYLLIMTEEHASECMDKVVVNPEFGAIDCFKDNDKFTPEGAWRDFLDVVRKSLEPDPKKKSPEDYDVSSEVLHRLAARPSKMQKLIQRFTASRRELLKALLDAPPPSDAKESTSGDERDDAGKEVVNATATSGKKMDDLEAFDEIIFESAQKYLGAIRAAREDSAQSCNESLPDSVLTQLRELHTELSGVLSIADEVATGEGNEAARRADAKEGTVVSEKTVSEFNKLEHTGRHTDEL